MINVSLLINKNNLNLNMCKCDKEVKIGDYSNQIVLDVPKHMKPFKNILGKEKAPYISIDKCLEEEIKYLWSLKIKTLGCCCGHNINKGYIQVTDEYVEIMEQMDYQHIDKNEDENAPNNAFYPKNKYN